MTEEFFITDGTTTVNFFNDSGYLLQDYDAQLSTLKSDVWADSPLAAGRIPLWEKQGNISQLFVATFYGSTTAQAASRLATLDRLLKQSSQYHIAGLGSPVYLGIKANAEANYRYALLYQGRIEKIGKTFGPGYNEQTVLVNGTPYYGLVDIEIGIEHGEYMAYPPGQGVAVTLNYAKYTNQKFYATFTQSNPADLPSFSAIRVLTSGTVLAGMYDVDATYENIYRSTDGSTFSEVSSNIPATNIVLGIYELSSGNILAGTTFSNYKTWKSTDDGVTWNEVSSTHAIGGGGIIRNYNQNLVEVNGVIYALVLYYDGGEVTAIASSDDEGATWTVLNNEWSNSPTSQYYGLIYSTALQRFFVSVYDSSTIKILASDNGTDWDVVHIANDTTYTTNTAIITELQTGHITVFAYGTGPYCWTIQSQDGFSWTETSTGITMSPLGVVSTQYQNFLAMVYADNPSGGAIYGTNDGINFTLVQTPPDSTWEQGFAIDERSNGIYIGTQSGASGFYTISILTTPETIETGSTEAFISNDPYSHNITHVKHYDASLATFTDLDQYGSYPMDLFPVSIATGDYVAFAIEPQSGYSSPQLWSLILDLSSGIQTTTIYGGGYTTVWEITSDNSGVDWEEVAIISDKTRLGGGAPPLTNPGRNTVTFNYESLTDSNGSEGWNNQMALDGVTAVWLRCRFSYNGTTLSSPQINSWPSIINTPFVEIPAPGNTFVEPAMNVIIENVSDEQAASYRYSYTNRVVMGSRVVSRGAYFQSHLMASDRNPIRGVQVQVPMGYSYFSDNPGIASGRYVYVIGTLVTSWQHLLTFYFNQEVANHYTGLFKVFLWANRNWNWKVLAVPEGGTASFSTSVTYSNAQTNNDWAIDLGYISLPPFDSGGRNSPFSLQVWGQSVYALDNSYIYGLILIPADEFFIDTHDPSHTGLIGGSDPTYLAQIGNLVNPLQYKSYLVNKYRNVTVANLSVIQGGYQNGISSNKDSRLWFFPMRWATSGGATPGWDPYGLYHKISIELNERYRIHSEE